MKTLESSPSLEKSPKTRHKTKAGHREFLCPGPFLVFREHLEAGNFQVVLTELDALGIPDPVNKLTRPTILQSESYLVDHAR